LQLNVSASLREKLDLARALLSHAVPSGDYAELVERALDVLLEKTRKQRFAQTKLARRTSGAISSARKSALVLRGKSTRREHIPNAPRREIIERDGFRCTFISEDGCRCSATSFLQIHHEYPWARGGESTVGNLRLLCSAHNRLLAERDFGRDVVAARREARQARAQLCLPATESTSVADSPRDGEEHRPAGDDRFGWTE